MSQQATSADQRSARTELRHIAASGAPSDRQFVGIMIACHSAFTGGASHGGARPD